MSTQRRPPPWLAQAAGGWYLRLHVQPGASRTECAGVHGDCLMVRVAAVPTEGHANAELVEFLATRLNLRKSALIIRQGASSRSKRIEIQAPELSIETVIERLSAR